MWFGASFDATFGNFFRILSGAIGFECCLPASKWTSVFWFRSSWWLITLPASRESSTGYEVSIDSPLIIVTMGLTLTNDCILDQGRKLKFTHCRIGSIVQVQCIVHPAIASTRIPFYAGIMCRSPESALMALASSLWYDIQTLNKLIPSSSTLFVYLVI